MCNIKLCKTPTLDTAGQYWQCTCLCVSKLEQCSEWTSDKIVNKENDLCQLKLKIGKKCITNIHSNFQEKKIVTVMLTLCAAKWNLIHWLTVVNW